MLSLPCINTSLLTAPLARGSSIGATTLALSMLTIGPTACNDNDTQIEQQRTTLAELNDPQRQVEAAKKLFSDIKPGRSVSIPYHCMADGMTGESTKKARNHALEAANERYACQNQVMDFQRIVNNDFGQEFTVSCDTQYTSNFQDYAAPAMLILSASCSVTKLPLAAAAQP